MNSSLLYLRFPLGKLGLALLHSRRDLIVYVAVETQTLSTIHENVVKVSTVERVY